MATKHKGVSSLVTFTKPGSKKLAGILSAPQTSAQKKTVKKSISTYAYYVEKWKNQT